MDFKFTKAQALAFTDSIVGFDALGVDCNGESVETEKAREARAFMSAHFGLGNLPHSAWNIRNQTDKCSEIAVFFHAIAVGLTEES